MTDPAINPAKLPSNHHVVVIGGGIAGLVAALECARIGVQVTVVEASDRLGGCVRAEDVAGLSVDTGAESFATRGGTVAALIESLGLADAVVAPNAAGAWVQFADGRAAPLPKAGVLGIPSNPLADDVRAVIGWRGAIRAYLDRIRPVLTIGREHNLGELVEKRMGRAVLDNLVAPVTNGVYSTDPSELDVVLAAPGLNKALTVAGSLSGAVGMLRESRPAGSAVNGLRGGMYKLVEALVAELDKFGARFEMDAAAASIERVSDADDEDAAEQVAPAFEPAQHASARWRVHLASDVHLDADVVVVATPEAQAFDLLAGHVAAFGDEVPIDAPAVEIVTLVIDSAALDAHPRGTGVLTGNGTTLAAKALTHSTAKWDWLAESAADAAPHRHVVRVSYGRQDEADAAAERNDDEARELARHDASALLGVDIAASAIVGSLRTPWRGTLPGARIGQRDRSTRLRDAVIAVDGLEVTGAWLSGTGLASVIPDATLAAGRIRHRVVADVLDLD